jgi:hypothetical protein
MFSSPLCKQKKVLELSHATNGVRQKHKKQKEQKIMAVKEKQINRTGARLTRGG